VAGAPGPARPAVGAVRRPLVAVFGSSTIPEGGERYREAEDLGRRLAEGGADVVTGGYGGAMAACSRGARAAGGHVVGVTVELFERRAPANPWVEERVHTPDLFERLRTIIGRADGFIAVAGSVGTLAEVFLTWNLLMAGAHPGAPLVLMGGHWRAWLEAQRTPDFVLPELFAYVRVADTPAEAVRAVLDGRAGPEE
jgi:uncharacterized protein (TIGR00730 family)